jgi:hypothetical protein
MSDQATISQPSIDSNSIKTAQSRKLVTTGPGHVFEKFVTNVRLKARETRQILIGSSNSPMPPKGFSIELKPHKMPAETLVTKVTAEGSTRRYDYVLDITNCSDRSVSAQIWQM